MKIKEKEVNLSKFQYKPFKFLFFVMEQKKWFGAGATMCVIFAQLLQIGSFVLLKDLVDMFIESSGSVRNIYEILFIFLGVLIASTLLFRLSGFLALRWVTASEIFAVNKSFNYLLNHSAHYFSERLSGKLQSKISNISRAINTMIPILLWNFLSLFVKLITSTVLAFIVHPIIGWVFVSFVMISVIYNILVTRRLAKYSRKRADAVSTLGGIVVDIISNVLAVKQNVARTTEKMVVQKSLGKYKKIHVKTFRYLEKVILFSSLLLIVMFGVTMFVTINLWQLGLVSVGSVVLLLTILFKLYGDLEFLSMAFNRFMEQYGQLKESLEEVCQPHGIVDKLNSKKVVIKNGDISFEEVDFQYEVDESQSVFEKLNLSIPDGQKIGLVGESGAGKSTFVSLLLRFMDVNRGSIKIDGYNITEIRQDDLRSAIAYVPQEALLFHRTLEENIKYSKVDATADEIRAASQRAHALEFIQNFPKDFQTLVGERGIKLSGGQKQRVMIARAILKESPILVLDEATSSLDSHSEKLIQEALEELMKGRTTIIIAHRLSTLKQMDRIIVFDGGKIVEDGTHLELLEKKGKYFELWQHQSGALQ